MMISTNFQDPIPKVQMFIHSGDHFAFSPEKKKTVEFSMPSSSGDALLITKLYDFYLDLTK